MRYRVKIDEHVFQVEIVDLRARPVIAIVNGEPVEVWPENSGTAPIPAASPAQTASKSPSGSIPAAQSQPVLSQSLSSGREVRAPIPGVIVSIAVQPGDEVDLGQELLIIEAMKMKNTIRAARHGKIAEIKITTGQTVRHHDVLLAYAGE